MTCIAFVNNEIYTGSKDHSIICWNLNDLDDRIENREEMREADIETMKNETYWRVIVARKGKKKKGKSAVKKGKSLKN